MTFLRFIAALMVAGWHRCRRESGCVTIALESIRSLWNQPKGGHPRKADRLKHCLKCPVYYAPLGTCGSPLHKDAKDHTGKPMGCFCFMEYKAATRCNCWLYDESVGVMGWPEELNDFEPEPQ